MPWFSPLEVYSLLRGKKKKSLEDAPWRREGDFSRSFFRFFHEIMLALVRDFLMHIDEIPLPQLTRIETILVPWKRELAHNSLLNDEENLSFYQQIDIEKAQCNSGFSDILPQEGRFFFHCLAFPVWQRVYRLPGWGIQIKEKIPVERNLPAPQPSPFFFRWGFLFSQLYHSDIDHHHSINSDRDDHFRAFLTLFSHNYKKILVLISISSYFQDFDLKSLRDFKSRVSNLSDYLGKIQISTFSSNQNKKITLPFSVFINEPTLLSPSKIAVYHFEDPTGKWLFSTTFFPLSGEKTLLMISKKILFFWPQYSDYFEAIESLDANTQLQIRPQKTS